MKPGGRKLIAPGDIAPRRDSEHELYVGANPGPAVPAGTTVATVANRAG